MAGYKITNTSGIALNTDNEGISIPSTPNVAGLRTSGVPTGSLVFSTADSQFYGFNGTSWVRSSTSGTSGSSGTGGSSGTSGSSGSAGTAGTSGSAGTSGTSGITGPQGETGPQGPQGPIGPQGPQGPTGPQGIQGPNGTSGSSGTGGTSGTSGSAGTAGTSGIQGPQGPQGPQGFTGPQGVTGPQGNQGPIGPQGVQGPGGSSGTSGNSGTSGTSGGQGLQGPQGPTGPQGLTGPQGNQGPIGPQGFQGPSGTSGTSGGQGPQGQQGPQGVAGTSGTSGGQGPQGPQGPSAGITSYTNPGDNRVITSVNSTTINAESNLTFDGNTVNITPGDVGLKVQENGTSVAWRGRLGSFNSSANKSSFLGNYTGRPGVFGHDNGLTAWAELYVNTLGIYGQGDVYLSWFSYVRGNGNDTNYPILHSANYNSYSPTLTGGGASGTWSINVTGNAQHLANNGNSPVNANDIWRAGVYTWFNGTNVPGGDFGMISIPTWQSTSSGSRYNLQIGANINGSLLYRTTDINGAGTFRTVLDSSNFNSYAPTLIGTGASGTWGINITGASGTTRFVESPDGSRNPNTFAIPTTNPRSVRFDFSVASAVTGATGNYAGVMTYSPWDGTSASTGDSSYQLAFCNFTGLNASGLPGLALRNGINSSWNSTWYQVLHSGNYTSYAPSLTGSGASGSWSISVTGSSGSVSGLTLTSSGSGINPDNVTQNQLGYNTSVNLYGQTDGGLYSSAFNSNWIHQIYGDFRTGQIAIRGKNSGTWQAWRSVLDSGNFSSYALPLTGGTMTGNITITSADIRSNAASGWTGDPGAQGKIQYHANRWYIVADQSSDRIVQFRRNATDVSHIANDGTFNGNISGSASTVSHFASRTDSAAYNVVWAAGNPSHMYSCDAVNIQSSSGTLNATNLAATRSFAAMAPTVASTNWNTSFGNTPVSAMAWGGDVSAGGPSGTWWFQVNMRHSNSSNLWGTQLAYGWEDNANEIYQRNISGGNFSGWVRYLNTNNYNSFALPLTGGNLSGTLSFSQPVGLLFANGQYIRDNGGGGLIINSGAAVNINGTSVTINGNIALHAGNFTSYAVSARGRTNWNDSTVINNVVGMLAWKNYGNNHVIFDASQSTSPSGSSVNNANAAVPWTGTYPTLMGWNEGTTYGVRVDSARVADSAGSVSNGVYTNSSINSLSGILNFGANNATPYFNATGLTNGIAFGGPESSSLRQYGVFTEIENIGGAYSKLTFNYHTGIRLGASTSYGGTRFYNDAAGNGSSTVIFSVGNGDGNVRATNDVIAYASDRRLKHRVQPIENALSKVVSLTGMTYQWNDVASEHGWVPDREMREAGVFAQDVQAVLPEAVRLAPFDDDMGVSKSGEDFLTVKYEKLVPLLIEALKELNEKVEEQDKLIKSLLDR